MKALRLFLRKLLPRRKTPQPPTVAETRPLRNVPLRELLERCDTGPYRRK